MLHHHFLPSLSWSEACVEGGVEREQRSQRANGKHPAHSTHQSQGRGKEAEDLFRVHTRSATRTRAALATLNPGSGISQQQQKCQFTYQVPWGLTSLLCKESWASAGKPV